MREKLIDDMMTEIMLLERMFENVYTDKEKKKIKQQINEKIRHINFMLNY